MLLMRPCFAELGTRGFSAPETESGKRLAVSISRPYETLEIPEPLENHTLGLTMPLGPRVDLTRSAIATAPTKDAWRGARRTQPMYEHIRLRLWYESQQATPQTGLARVETNAVKPEHNTTDWPGAYQHGH